MRKKTSPFKLDTYRSRSERVDYIEKADSIYARTWFSNLAVLAFVFIDLFCLKVVWNLVQTEDPLYVWCIAFACAAALDVPLALAAIAMKRYHQGIGTKKEKNIILILSVGIFAVAFVFSFGFRLITKDLSFEIGTGSTLTNTMSASTETDGNNPAVLFAALFNGIVPLLTSGASFVISYFGYDPLGMKLLKLGKERIGLQANIHEAEKALGEASTSEVHCQGLIAREDDLYAAFLEQIDADALNLKQMVRVMMMERLGSPDDITSMTKSAEELEKSFPYDATPGKELPEFINVQLANQEKNLTKHVNYAA